VSDSMVCVSVYMIPVSLVTLYKTLKVMLNQCDQSIQFFFVVTISFVNVHSGRSRVGRVYTRSNTSAMGTLKGFWP